MTLSRLHQTEFYYCVIENTNPGKLLHYRNKISGIVNILKIFILLFYYFYILFERKREWIVQQNIATGRLGRPRTVKTDEGDKDTETLIN